MERPAGYPRRVTVVVRCARCGSAYETEAPIAAIRQVNRCRECGGGPLVIDDEDEEEHATDPDAAERPTQPG